MNERFETRFERPLWRWNELCEALGISVCAGPDVTGITFDSRKVQAGDLFVAIPGDPGPRFNVSQRTSRDGHEYVQSACERGAVGALVHKSVSTDRPLLRVQDTIDGLWGLARYRRAQLSCPVVAITGSSGKTTLKEFLARSIPAFFTEGSFNNYLGLPLSVALTPFNVGGVVYEIGTNHAGEIAPLSNVANPDVAVVLNVLPVHIGHFADLDELTIEKMSISQGLVPYGTFVCSTTLATSEYAPRVPTVTFGFDSDADVQIKSIDGDHYSYSSGGEFIEIDVPGGGRHRAETLGAAAAVLKTLRLPLESLARIGNQLPKGRGNVHFVEGILIVDESYNANPASMHGALASLSRRSVDGRRISVLGQMNELGEKAVEYHSRLAEAANQADIVFCVGGLMKSLYENLAQGVEKHYFDQVDEQLMDQLLQTARPGDAVMVKGSHSFFWEADFVNQFISALRDQA
ncbi:MAG: Mur ligase family protein [Gammaproteobacteria bacterium]|nr:Mur ligase family protein [Gammaproteobacteria bacterium]